MNWNWITILLGILVLGFILYIYTKKYPIELLDAIESEYFDNMDNEIDSDEEQDLDFNSDESEGEGEDDPLSQIGMLNKEMNGDKQNQYFLKKSIDKKRDENNNNNDKQIENFSVYSYASPFCYGRSANSCISSPGCNWDPYYGCQSSQNIYRPWYSNIYNYYYRYWSPYRWFNRRYYWPRYRRYPYRWRTYGRGLRRFRRGRRGMRRGSRGMRRGSRGMRRGSRRR